MESPRLLDLAEFRALVGQTVKVIAVGMDAFGFEDEAGRTIAVVSCFGCGGPGAHLNLFEADPEIFEGDGFDPEA